MTANEAVLVGTAFWRCVKRDIQPILRESPGRVKAIRVKTPPAR